MVAALRRACAVRRARMARPAKARSAEAITAITATVAANTTARTAATMTAAAVASVPTTTAKLRSAEPWRVANSFTMASSLPASRANIDYVGSRAPSVNI
jgi:hypothetical protein